MTLQRKRNPIMKISKSFFAAAFVLFFGALSWAGSAKEVTFKAFVIDSSCAFTKSLDKPISRECAVKCANAGSALVLLASDGEVYWPISDETPAKGQNARLLPFAGQKVSVTGKVYSRGGSQAIVIEKIEAAAADK
jgi:type 1 fimbria pilin